MVSLGGILVGGKNTANSKLYMSGIAFKLSAQAQDKKIYIFDGWEVDICASSFIVARSENNHSRDKIHELGYEVCEKALDLYSAEGHGDYSISEPNFKYIDLSFESGKLALCLQDVCNLSVYMSASYKVIDKDGNIMALCSFDKMPLFVSKVSKLTIIMNTCLISHGDSRHYL